MRMKGDLTMFDTTINRRNFVKGAAAMALGTAALGATVANANQASGVMIPGVYTATTAGFAGQDTVYVTVSESAILSIDVVSTDEPVYITKHAVEQIPAAIIEGQSVSVDAVTGATFTSNAIMRAVADCVEQAGGVGLFDAAPAKAIKAEGETVDTDILVIGAGFAGLSAAYATAVADLDDVPSGVSVTLIEKQAMVGGSMPFAVGGFFTATPINGTPTQALIDSEIERMEMANPDPLNVDLLTSLLTASTDTVYKLRGLGMPLRVATDDSTVTEAVAKGFNTDTFVLSSYSGDYPEGWGSGCTLVETFRLLLQSNGIDVRLNTAALNLIVEDGAVVGATVEGPESTYEIRAKKVILSCGGMAQNREMIAQYAPKDVNSLVWCNGGADGDGLRMGVEVGGQPVGERLYGYPMIDNVNGLHHRAAHLNTNNFIVNKDGQTFTSNGKVCAQTYCDLADQPDGVGFNIFDSNYPFAADFAAGVEDGSLASCVFRGDTLEELAEACEMNTENFVATVAAWNQHLAERDPNALNGDLFEGAEAPGATSIETGPFYAVHYVQVHLGSLVGLACDGDCRILDADGSPIPNLYGTGEVILGGNIFTYHCGGWGLGTALFSGRLAAEDAKAAIAAQA